VEAGFESDAFAGTVAANAAVELATRNSRRVGLLSDINNGGYGCGKGNTTPEVSTLSCSGLWAVQAATSGPSCRTRQHMSSLRTRGTLVLSAVWRQRSRIDILRESLQDTVRVSHLPPAEPDSAQDSQSKVFTEAR
jgi:hypothetical protein